MRQPATFEFSIGFRINRLATLVRRQLTRSLEPYGLNAERWQILAAVVDAQPRTLSQSEIAHLILKDRYAVSRMLDKMAADGWIEREPDAEHGRIQRIRATADAVDQFETIKNTLVDGFAVVRDSLTDTEHAELLRITDHLIATLDAIAPVTEIGAPQVGSG
jgi:DNA-binding MarR family transcriptional regulator